MSQDHHGEVATFSAMIWFRMPARQLMLAEPWKNAHWEGMAERSDAHVHVRLCSARSIRRRPRVTNGGICGEAVLVRLWDIEVRTDSDPPVTKQRYTTNWTLDRCGRTPLCTRCALGTTAHSLECRARFEAIWTPRICMVRQHRPCYRAHVTWSRCERNSAIRNPRGSGTTCCHGGSEHRARR